MRPRRSGHRVATALAMLLAVLAIAYFHSYIALYSPYPTDDAYIHFRMARNFVEHGQPYYNLEEPVLASSSVFWLLFVSAVFEVVGTRIDILPYAALAFTVVLFLLCTVLLARRFSPLTAVCVAFLIVAAFGLSVAAELMETPAALVFFLAAVVLFQHRRFVGFGVLSALALLTRYEFALWLPIAFVLLPDRPARTRFMWGAAVPLLGGAAFSLGFFGTLVPHAVLAKSRVVQMAPGEFFSTLEMSWREVALLAVVAALLLNAARRPDTPAAGTAIALFPLLLFGAYAAARTLLFEWYLPLVFLPLVLSCFLILPARQLLAVLLVLVAVRPLAIAAVREGYGVLVGDATRYREYAMGTRVRQYLHIGAELNEQFPGAVLMAAEIGGLGWTFRGKIIDGAAALVSPECLKYHPVKAPEDRPNGLAGAIPPQAVRDLSPRLIVSMETFTPALRRDLASGRLPGYRLLHNYPVINEVDSARSGIVGLWGARYTQVYIRD